MKCLPGNSPEVSVMVERMSRVRLGERVGTPRRSTSERALERAGPQPGTPRGRNGDQPEGEDYEGDVGWPVHHRVPDPPDDEHMKGVHRERHRAEGKQGSDEA